MPDVNYVNGMGTKGTGSMVSAVIDEKAGLSKKDILGHFAQHDLMDELMVCSKYLDYYSAVKDECPETAHLCKQMAKDEWSHARAQRDCLLKNGYSMTDDGEMKYQEVKKRIEEIFR